MELQEIKPRNLAGKILESMSEVKAEVEADTNVEPIYG